MVKLGVQTGPLTLQHLPGPFKAKPTGDYYWYCQVKDANSGVKEGGRLRSTLADWVGLTDGQLATPGVGKPGCIASV